MTIYSNILLDRDSFEPSTSRQRNRVSCGKMSKGYDTYRAIMQMHENLKNIRRTVTLNLNAVQPIIQLTMFFFCGHRRNTFLKIGVIREELF